MAIASRGAALQAIGRLFERGTITALGEGALLERFISHGDTDAFEALVARHGPMVLGVCRRGLIDPHDVEDAFQATFLVLVRKAASLRNAEQLGPWLFGVARKVTARARSQASLRRTREQPGDSETFADRDSNILNDKELRSILDEEIGRLPERYRDPIVLCYLEGLTHDEAAQRLGCPVGTVRSRMAWARQRLRARLDRRGLAPTGVLALPVPPALTTSTISAATSAAAGTLSLSTTAIILAQGVTTAMFVKKVCLVASVSAICAASLISGGAVLSRAYAGDGPKREARETKPTTESSRELGDFPTVDTTTLKPFNDPNSRPATRAEVLALREQNALLQEGIRSLLKEVRELRKEVDVLARVDHAPAAPAGMIPANNVIQPFPVTSAPQPVPAAEPAPSAVFPHPVPTTSVPQPIPASEPAPRPGFAPSAVFPQPVPNANVPQAFPPGPPEPSPRREVDPFERSTVEPQPPGPSRIPQPGKPAVSRVPTTHQCGNILAVVSPSGDQILAKNSMGGGPGLMMGAMMPGPASTMTGAPAGFQLYRSQNGVKLTPVLMNYMMALQFEGAQIGELAVYNSLRGKWSVHKLAQPANEVVTPIVEDQYVIYPIGNRIDSYSAQANRWDSVEFAGAPRIVNTPFGPSYQDDTSLFALDVQKGTWKRIDFESLLKEAAQPNEDAPTVPRPGTR